MPKLITCLLLLLACLGAPSLARAADCTEVTVPSVINSPGRYCLAAHLSVNITANSAIAITADDVDFDCRGYTIRNAATNPSGNAYGVSINNHRNVSVRNCRIQGGFAAGIYAYQDNGQANINKSLTFTGNTVTGAYWFGILAYGTDIDISDNRIYNIGGRASFAMGIRVGGSNLAGQGRTFHVSDNVIHDVVSPANTGYGIYANNSYGSAFVDNKITGSAGGEPYTGYGVMVYTGGKDKITGNQIIGPQVGQDVGVSAPASDACYDNFIRSSFLTMNCNDALGNF